MQIFCFKKCVFLKIFAFSTVTGLQSYTFFCVLTYATLRTICFAVHTKKAAGPESLLP